MLCLPKVPAFSLSFGGASFAEAVTHCRTVSGLSLEMDAVSTVEVDALCPHTQLLAPSISFAITFGVLTESCVQDETA
jgi:hypothetical protein